MSGSDDDDDVAAGIKPTPEEWKHILKPTAHDVLCGRGGGTNNHPGNVKFRQTINEHKLRYLAASKVEKPKVAREVVDIWRSLDPPGRFLARKDDSKRGPGSVKAEGNVWYDIGDKKAREKASQCLRERTPDVLPYVREMQRQQDALTGQGLRMVEHQIRMQSDTGMNMNPGVFNGQMYVQNMMGAMNGLDGFNPARTSMSEPDINNAFSVEHFFTHGFQNMVPSQPVTDDPLSLQQISRDPNWDPITFDGGMNMSINPSGQVFSSTSHHDLNPIPLPLGADFGNVPDLVESSGLVAKDELTLEEYMDSMQSFKAYHLDSELKEKPRTGDLLQMQSNSWVKSFHSIENGSKAGDITVNDSIGSCPREKKRSKPLTKKLDLLNDVSLSKQTSTRTHLSNATQKSSMSHVSTKSAQSTMSGLSMFSEMSGMSRSSKMSENRNQASTLSVMSDFTELTDLSEALNNIDIQSKIL
jgi:hypothetical protein